MLSHAGSGEQPQLVLVADDVVLPSGHEECRPPKGGAALLGDGAERVVGAEPLHRGRVGCAYTRQRPALQGSPRVTGLPHRHAGELVTVRVRQLGEQLLVAVDDGALGQGAAGGVGVDHGCDEGQSEDLVAELGHEVASEQSAEGVGDERGQVEVGALPRAAFGQGVVQGEEQAVVDTVAVDADEGDAGSVAHNVWVGHASSRAQGRRSVVRVDG